MSDSLLIRDFQTFVESGAVAAVHRPLMNRVLNALELCDGERIKERKPDEQQSRSE